MPRLSKKTMFAIEAVLDVACHVGEHPVRSGDITERQRIPKRYLEQVLQHLVRAGILAGKRGPRGGYRLGRDKSHITLGEVVRVVRRLEAETEPNDLSVGSPLAHEVVWPMWEKLRDDMMMHLDTITIDELCQRAHAKGLNVARAKPQLPSRVVV
ncbi:Rrf2 family transcriptional regulator [Reyranella sp.]|uniref:RrF2 family transcriptional regulator n=1 Tax=Reyranella sp. TaxID=1929291 RepID=UPI002F952242